MAACPQCGMSLTAAETSNPYQSPTAAERHAPPPAGPSDRQFRIGAAIVVPVVALGMLAAVFGLSGQTLASTVVVGIGWFAVFFGIAALVDPNIARAAGKYGTHLPPRYKLIAGVVGVAALACSLASMYFLFLA